MGDLLEYVKKFLSSWLVLYILKIGGSVFGTIGLTEADVTKIVVGIVALIFGFIGQKLQVNTALNTPPPTN
jgi:hypothetical protein